MFRAAAEQLAGRRLPPGPLPLRALRNADFQEVTLEVGEGRPPLRFALAYGFRNIQTLVRARFLAWQPLFVPDVLVPGGGSERGFVGSVVPCVLS